MKKLILILILLVSVLLIMSCKDSTSANLDFKVTVVQGEGGSIYLPGQVEKSLFRAGDTVALDIRPNEGYSLSSLTYTLGARPLPVKSNQFFMPSGDVTVQAVFVSKYDFTIKLSHEVVSLIDDFVVEAEIIGGAERSVEDEVKLDWNTYDTSVAIVDGSGRLKAISPGETVLQARDPVTGKYAEALVVVIDNIFIVSGDTITKIKPGAKVPENLVIPEYISSVEIKEIGSFAFKGAPVKSVKLPSTLVKIGDGAFKDVNLKEIEIPESVTSIGKDVFAKGLELIKFKGSVPPVLGSEKTLGEVSTSTIDMADMIPEIIVSNSYSDVYRRQWGDYYHYNIRSENESFVRVSEQYISTSRVSAVEGEVVQINIAVPDGKQYKLGDVDVVFMDKAGNLSVSQDALGVMNFVMRDSRVRVSVSLTDQVGNFKFTDRSLSNGFVVPSLDVNGRYYKVNAVGISGGYRIKEVRASRAGFLEGSYEPKDPRDVKIFDEVKSNMEYQLRWDGVIDEIIIDVEWIEQKYTITLATDGGEYTDSSRTVEAIYGDLLPGDRKGSAPAVPKKAGYNFAGYYLLQPNGGITQYYNEQMRPVEKWLIARNETITARWTPKTYTVTLKATEDLVIKGENEKNRDILVTYGQFLPNTVLAPVGQEGYKFEGYVDDKGLFYYGGGSSVGSTMIPRLVWDKIENTSLTPRWSMTSTVITLHPSYPEVPDELVASNTRSSKPWLITRSSRVSNTSSRYGHPLPVQVISNMPSMTHFKFLGYYSGLYGTGDKYYDENFAPVKNWDILEPEVELYAHWTFDGKKFAGISARGRSKVAFDSGIYGVGDMAGETTFIYGDEFDIVGEVSVYFEPLYVLKDESKKNDRSYISNHENFSREYPRLQVRGGVSIKDGASLKSCGVSLVRQIADFPLLYNDPQLSLSYDDSTVKMLTSVANGQTLLSSDKPRLDNFRLVGFYDQRYGRGENLYESWTGYEEGSLASIVDTYGHWRYNGPNMLEESHFTGNTLRSGLYALTLDLNIEGNKDLQIENGVHIYFEPNYTETEMKMPLLGIRGIGALNATMTGHGGGLFNIEGNYPDDVIESGFSGRSSGESLFLGVGENGFVSVKNLASNLKPEVEFFDLRGFSSDKAGSNEKETIEVTKFKNTGVVSLYGTWTTSSSVIDISRVSNSSRLLDASNSRYVVRGTVGFNTPTTASLSGLSVPAGKKVYIYFEPASNAVLNVTGANGSNATIGGAGGGGGAGIKVLDGSSLVLLGSGKLVATGGAGGAAANGATPSKPTASYSVGGLAGGGGAGGGGAAIGGGGAGGGNGGKGGKDSETHKNTVVVKGERGADGKSVVKSGDIFVYGFITLQLKEGSGRLSGDGARGGYFYKSDKASTGSKEGAGGSGGGGASGAGSLIGSGGGGGGGGGGASSATFWGGSDLRIEGCETSGENGKNGSSDGNGGSAGVSGIGLCTEGLGSRNRHKSQYPSKYADPQSGGKPSEFPVTNGTLYWRAKTAMPSLGGSNQGLPGRPMNTAS
ncbi:MAG: leucine-rich repeat protein [Treponemataceae bacterium]